MLEKMGDFFSRRLDGYEEHQLNAIDGAREFYPLTASLLPMQSEATVLDLGCGTGLELEYYFKLNPTAKVTCVDLSEEMLNILKEKFSDKAITIIHGSYFDVTFEKKRYDAAVSVESLHHFTKDAKTSLYKKILQSLAAGGSFILTDYFAQTEEEENFFRQELLRLKAEQKIRDNALYHYDTPLTADHETQALQEAGFSNVEILAQWGATCIIKAVK